jgi:hypothetical protein
MASINQTTTPITPITPTWFEKSMNEVHKYYNCEAVKSLSESLIRNDKLNRTVQSTFISPEDLPNWTFEEFIRRLCELEINELRVSSASKGNIPKQETVTITFGDIMGRINSKHWHQENQCVTPHEESLTDHLVGAGYYAWNMAKALDWNPVWVYLATFAAFVHDIGKVSTFYENTKMGTISFKGHGPVGGACVSNMFLQNIQKLNELFGFTREMIVAVSTMCDVHMCSYFDGQNTPYHNFLSRSFPLPVKPLLILLAIGDHLSMKQSESACQQTHTYVLEQIPLYAESIFAPPGVSNYNGAIILVTGSSGVGKTTAVGKLVSELGCKHEIIERDKIMEKIVSEQSGESNLSYVKLYEYYVRYKLAPKVNSEMHKLIESALANGRIPIVDTVAVMYPLGPNQIIPKSANNALMIMIACHQTMQPIQGIHHGQTVETRLAALSNFNALNPYASFSRWNSICPITEGRGPSMKDHPTQADQQRQPDVLVSCSHIKCDFDWLINMIKCVEQNAVKCPPPSIYSSDTNITLGDLMRQTWKYCNGSIEKFKEMFQGFVIKQPTPEFPHIISICYSATNRNFSTKLARETRGRVFDVSTGMEIKGGYIQGAELLSFEHLEAGMKMSQDITVGSTTEPTEPSTTEPTEPSISVTKFLRKANGNEKPRAGSVLDPTQAFMSKLFQTPDQPIPNCAYLTLKADGSSFPITLVPPGSPMYELMCSLFVTIEHTNPFTFHLYQYCVANGHPLIFVSTQRTLFVAPDMQDYILTALTGFINIEQSITRMDQWSIVIPHLVKKLLDYRDLLIEQNIISSEQRVTWMFEALCENNQTITGTKHTELASQNQVSSLVFLGMLTYPVGPNPKCELCTFIPHFELPRRWLQPAHIKITNTSQATQLIQQLNQVIIGDMAVETFMSQFEIIDEFTARFCQEGFVVLMKMTESEYWEYAKLKSLPYYVAHNCTNPANIMLAMDIFTTEQLTHMGKYFSAFNQINQFVKGINTKLPTMISQLYRCLIDEISLGSKSSLCTMSAGIGTMINRTMIDQTIENSDPIQLRKTICAILSSKTPEVSRHLGGLFDLVTVPMYGIQCVETSASGEIIVTPLYQKIRNLLCTCEPWSCTWRQKFNEMFELKEQKFLNLLTEFFIVLIGTPVAIIE